LVCGGRMYSSTCWRLQRKIGRSEMVKPTRRGLRALAAACDRCGRASYHPESVILPIARPLSSLT
jgi:hypothetical protein